MSQFTTPAILEMLDNYKWRLVEPFDYYTQEPCSGMRWEWFKVNSNTQAKRIWIEVPADYVTDLASVPRVLWSVFPPHGRYAKAAIVHDYLYSNAIGTKTWADQVFLEAMTILNVPRWRRWLMYQAVRLFGRGNYQLQKKESNG